MTQYKKPDQKPLNGEFNAIHAQNSLSSIYEDNERREVFNSAVNLNGCKLKLNIRYGLLVTAEL